MLLAALFLASSTRADVADYRVHFDPSSTRLSVTATLPVADSTLAMAESRPAGIAELDSAGWRGLVTKLHVTDASGREVPVVRNRQSGWRLAASPAGRLTVEYEVDYAPLEKARWPAPREAAYRDPGNFVVVGRSLFVTTNASGECRVTFDLPAAWSVSAPWRLERSPATFVAGTPDNLVENLIVLSRGPRDVVSSGGFRVLIHALGRWDSFRPEARKLLQSVARHHVRMMDFKGRRDYVVVFLPQLENGGESYRSSFAVNTDSLPETVSVGNLIAHEMFHLWNGWTLRPAEYMPSQWFQEGFTEYAANLAIARSGLVGDDWLRGKLAQHIANARRLTTPLDNPGTHKGPPLYSAGALVAFIWDTRIRETTAGRRNLGDFFRELMRRTDGGRRAYTWADLRASLETVAPGDWDGDSIHGQAPPPIGPALAAVGQRLVEGRVEADPAASAAARRRWSELSRDR